MLVKILQAHIIQYIQQLKCDTQHLQKPPKHCFMHRTATKQQMELEICVHDTTLHPSEEKEMERNEMRSSRHLHT